MAKELTAEDFELPYEDEDEGTSEDEDQGSLSSGELDFDLDSDDQDGREDDLAFEEDDDEDFESTAKPQAQKKSAADPLEGNKALKGRLLDYQKRGHKQGYNEGYAKAKAEADANNAVILQRLAALEGTSVEAEAQALVAEKGLSLDDAKLLARARRGIVDAGQEQPKLPARNAAGQFTAKEQTPEYAPEVMAQAQKLLVQAETILNTTGIDMLELLKTNPKVHDAVINRGYDFNAVAKKMLQRDRGRVPATARGTGAGTEAANRILNMTDDEFDKLDHALAAGKRIRDVGGARRRY